MKFGVMLMLIETKDLTLMNSYLFGSWKTQKKKAEEMAKEMAEEIEIEVIAEVAIEVIEEVEIEVTAEMVTEEETPKKFRRFPNVTGMPTAPEMWKKFSKGKVMT